MLSRLGTGATRGLDPDEAARRLRQVGPNLLPREDGPSLLSLFLSQFSDVLVLVLLGAMALSWALGERADAVVIGAIVGVNAVLGFVQEYRAERSLAALQALLAPAARVVRGGEVRRVAAAELVPGDVILLEAGDRVPADGRILEAAALEVEEAALTGESLPVSKRPQTLDRPDLAVGDRRNMVYLGTNVTRGRARAVVVATGTATEAGHIATMIAGAPPGPTPLEIRLAQLSHVLVLACLVVSLAVVFLGLLRGEPLVRMFLAGVSLAVAAIPEGLPAVVTVGLAVGVQRMLRRHAVIRRLPAVETLGATTVIGCDKTGTLTANAMTVRQVLTASQRFTVTGAGFAPQGEIVAGGVPGEIPTGPWAPTDGGPRRYPGPGSGDAHRPELDLAACIGALCNNARLVGPRSRGGGPARREEGGGAAGRPRLGRPPRGRRGCGAQPATGWRADGDPTEAALLTLAAKAGWGGGRLARRFTRRAEVPFSSERRRMSVVVQASRGEDPGGPPVPPGLERGLVLCAKGAADAILERCTRIYRRGAVEPLDEAARRRIQAQNDAMARRALRVLALAYRPLDAAESAGLDGADPGEALERDLVFAGLVGMMDPPRPEARLAIRRCAEAGIQVVMITGDHPLTAAAVARDLDLLPPEAPETGEAEVPAGVIVGRQIDAWSDRELAREIAACRVFARVSPGHKLRIVRAFKARGHVVAMTGDGVNDAPAVKAADIGISMGLSGTDVTREAAAVVLADDNFASIVAAVEEGRVVYANIRKFIRYLLACNTGEVALVLAATLGGWPLPLEPLQILWVNLVTDGLPATALAFDPAEPDTMRRPPRRPGEGVFSGRLGFKIATRGLLIGLLSFGMFAWGLTRPDSADDPLARARTLAFATICCCQFLHVFDCRSDRRGVLQVGLWSNPLLFGAILISLTMLGLAIYYPPVAGPLGSTPLGAADWIRVLGAASTITVGLELRRALLYRTRLLRVPGLRRVPRAAAARPRR